MTWLAPIAWVGLIATALPILIHLFARQRARTIKFPTLRFVPDTIVKPTRRTRISDPLLLLVRAAIIILAVAALARPVLHALARKQHTNRFAAAILVDTSSSMRRRSTGNSTALANAQSLADSTARTTPLHRIIRTASPAEALPVAAAWARAQQAIPEVTILSDFQAGTIDSTDVATLPSDVDLHFVPIPVFDSAQATPAATAQRVTILANPDDIAIAQATLDATYAAGAPRADRPLSIAFANDDAISTMRGHWRKPNTAALLEVAIRMRNDTTLNAAAASPALNTVGDTTLASRTLVVARTTAGSPLAAIAADAAGNPVIISFAEPGTLVAAAIIAAALDGVRSRTALEANPDVIAPGTLSRWRNRPPAALTDGDGNRNVDRNTNTDSDGRWLWLLALLLIGLETYLRRTTTATDSARDETAHDRAA